jgi:hypothetical protein
MMNSCKIFLMELIEIKVKAANLADMDKLDFTLSFPRWSEDA